MMEKRLDITVVTICHNEEENISQLIENVSGWAASIVAIDSGSTDNTVEILESSGAKVIYNEFIDFSQQRQFSLESVKLDTKWVLVLDADEYLTE